MATLSGTLPRSLVGVIGTALFALAVFYAASYADRAWGVPLTLGALALCALTVIRGSDRAWQRIAFSLRHVHLFLAFVAAGAPVLLYVFAHQTSERYLWVISQGGLCAHLGSAAAFVSAGLIGLMLSAGAVGLLLSSHAPSQPLWPRQGLITAVVTLAVAAGLVITAPGITASLLGCT
jgi:hypothetical protein